MERLRPSDERPEITTDRLGWQLDPAQAPFELELAPFFARVWGED